MYRIVVNDNDYHYCLGKEMNMNGTTKNSKQRDAILSTLRSTNTHPTAEWVYARLKPDFPSLSLATVYRNLNRFCETGEAIKIDVGDKTVHYDGFTHQHAHFYCKKCNNVLDINKDTDFTNEIETKYNVKLKGYSLVFFGECKDCSV